MYIINLNAILVQWQSTRVSDVASASRFPLIFWKCFTLFDFFVALLI